MSNLPQILPLCTVARLIGRSDAYTKRLCVDGVVRAASNGGIWRSSVEIYLGRLISAEDYVDAQAANEPSRARKARYRERQSDGLHA